MIVLLWKLLKWYPQYQNEYHQNKLLDMNFQYLTLSFFVLNQEDIKNTFTDAKETFWKSYTKINNLFNFRKIIAGIIFHFLYSKKIMILIYILHTTNFVNIVLLIQLSLLSFWPAKNIFEIILSKKVSYSNSRCNRIFSEITTRRYWSLRTTYNCFLCNRSTR